ncbi:MAG: hypothetical protein EZS28_025287 [Streblomastix strix]|uniref:Uncharacterized protein n=1 Tax=Streblomastix strix TaxID=222440 RepID=A0A5J4V9R0_9EUKA|nr:MAG: hypothetical protein EZS28_025287 [Streblomastix strix]
MAFAGLHLAFRILSDQKEKEEKTRASTAFDQLREESQLAQASQDAETRLQLLEAAHAERQSALRKWEEEISRFRSRSAFIEQRSSEAEHRVIQAEEKVSELVKMLDLRSKAVLLLEEAQKISQSKIEKQNKDLVILIDEKNHLSSSLHQMEERIKRSEMENGIRDEAIRQEVIRERSRGDRLMHLIQKMVSAEGRKADILNDDCAYTINENCRMEKDDNLDFIHSECASDSIATQPRIQMVVEDSRSESIRSIGIAHQIIDEYNNIQDGRMICDKETS